MRRFITNQEQDFCCKINEFLESQNRCLFVRSRCIENAARLIRNIQTDRYLFTDAFYHVSRPEELLFLLRQQKNPNMRPAEYGWFLGINETPAVSPGFNPFGIIHGALNLFRRNVVSFTDQIIDCLSNIGNYIGIILCIDKYLTQNMKVLIRELCENQNCVVKFVLLYDQEPSADYVIFQSFSNQEILSLCYSAEQLVPRMPLLSLEQINELLAVTNDNLDEIFNIYDQIADSRNSPANLLLDALIESSLGRIENEQNRNVLGIAAHLFSKFTAEELYGICRHANFDHSNHVIEEALEESVRRGIIFCSGEEYDFLSERIKQAFTKMLARIGTKLHKAIAQYLSERYPFAYRLRRKHLELAGDVYGANDMIAMEMCHMCHVSIQEDRAISDIFESVFGKNARQTLLSIYRCVMSGDYHGAQQICCQLVSVPNDIIQQEYTYLQALIDWKSGDREVLFRLRNALKMLVETDTTEPEFKILANMLRLSVISNLGEYSSAETTDTPNRIFLDIRELLNKYNGIEIDVLRNILYRKSNSALQRALAINLVKSSFLFFQDRKELYPYEYFTAGINYMALQLQSLDASALTSKDKSDKTDFPILEIAHALQQDLLLNNSPIIAQYFQNNYLLAKYFCAPNDFRFEEVAAFVANIPSVGLDSRIMFTMNVGTFYAAFQNYKSARNYWDSADQLNGHRDAYFDYIIASNRLICDICEGNAVSSMPSLPNAALFIYDTEIYQYIQCRNQLIQNLIKEGRRFSFEEVKARFTDAFTSRSNYASLLFYSQPFLFSDVQFWSEN